MAASFEHLITAIATAVVDAERIVQQAQISGIERYFDENNAPVSVELALPTLRSGSKEPATTTLKVPLISLVKPTQLSIEELQVSMDVEIGDLASPPAPPAAAAAEPDDLAASVQRAPRAFFSSTAPRPRAPALEVSTSGQATRGTPGSARVRLTVRAEQTPEGLARLIDHLNKQL